ncbi:SDR family NAD(P)-dependent oxidoreductase [Streptomyces sp. R302]|uniref:SDR family NAD(P)-dependent oxidoreductase n=1 Tax=unclassified Streptomyces TaxID=2593676 RepID=UPI00145DA243|nr:MULTISPECIES: SDR family NAD(P)-dependent oxidoreductase [unclassified Streptomyces]NML51122.1 SDR family NAD(P)-dependent oxidoreductase [Streptomyces sp. R301]NML79700.1 SDR family NAD(P)-dependent oxidoreductase [Streptomyces sp. R302]
MNQESGSPDVQQAADRVRGALRELPGITDWWVAAGPADTGVIAYVVPGRPTGHADLLRTLRRACPGVPQELGPHLVRLTALPRDPEGHVDQDRLAELPALGEDTLRAAERAAREAGATEARAAIVDARVPQPGGLVVRPDGADPVTGRQDGEAPPALLDGGRRTGDPDGPLTLVQALDRAAAGSAGVVFDPGTGDAVRLTYGELRDRAARVAKGLRGAGVRPGDPVLLPAGDNEEFLTAFWACQLSGAVAVPCAPVTAEAGVSAAERLQYVWELLQEPVIVTSDPTSVPPAVRERARLHGLDALTEAEPAAPAAIRPDAIAVMLLTSGSTGMPKLVTQTHAAILSMTAAARATLGLGADDVSVNWFPLDHVVGLLMCHVRDVYLRCEDVHVPTDAVLGDPLRWLDLLTRYRATLTWAPNFAFSLIGARAGDLGDRDWDLSRVRSIINAGEMVVAEQVRQFLAVLAPFGLRDHTVQPAWGMSETCSVVTADQDFSGTVGSLLGPVPVGGPFPGLSVRIVRPDGSTAVEGETGDLEVTGTMVTRGYHNNDKANAESFAPDGWFRTGDRAVIAAGSLTIVGRSKDVIRVNGISIPSTEVEAVVERSDRVLESFTAAVCYRPDNAATDEIAVFYSPRPGQQAEAVRADVRRRVLEHYGFPPRHVIQVRPEEIPKTSIGKIRRAVLAARLHAGEFDDRLARGAAAEPAGVWLARPRWRVRAARPTAPRTRDVDSARIVVLGADAATGGRLRALLNAHGHRCAFGVWDDDRQVDPMDPRLVTVAPTIGAVGAFLADGADGTRLPGEVVLAFPAEPRPEDARTLIGRQAAAIEQVLLVVRALDELGPRGPIRLTLLGAGLCAVTADDVPDLALSPLAGLAPSLDAELPWLRVRLIDAEPGDERAADGELLGEAVGAVVSYRGGVRRELWITGQPEPGSESGSEPASGSASGSEPASESGSASGSEPASESGSASASASGAASESGSASASASASASGAAPVTDGPSALFRRDAAYLVTGGLGGVGFEVCRHLLATTGCSLVLLGRTPLPEPSAPQGDGGTLDARRRRLRELEQVGRVRYLAVDNGDEDGLRAALAEVEADWNLPVAGAVHLAGLMDGVPVAELTPERLREVLAAKVEPALLLGRLIAERKGSVVAFSSVNAIFGGAQVAGYGAANAFLDAWAARLGAQGVPVHLLSWSRWQSTGMSAGSEDDELVRSRGYRVLTVEAALRAFDTAVRLPVGHTVIGLEPTNPFILARVDLPTAPLDRLEVRCLPLLADTGELLVDDLRGAPVAVAAVADPTGTGSREGADRETLATLAGIWQEVLAAPEVPYDAGFFDLGARSLQLPRVQLLIEKKLDTRVEISDFFAHPTVAALAAHLERLRGTGGGGDGAGQPEPAAPRRRSDRFGRPGTVRTETEAVR